jgi:hypothetical protein
MDDSTIYEEFHIQLRRLSKLVFDGLTGADTIHCWISWRIQPLQYRPSLMCDYSSIDDAQCYTREELTPEEVEHRVRNIIKVGRDEELKLKILMFENGSCLEVNQPSFNYYRLLFDSIPYSYACRSPHFLLSSLVPSSATRGLKIL